jgi:hypothetical protein
LYRITPKIDTGTTTFMQLCTSFVAATARRDGTAEGRVLSSVFGLWPNQNGREQLLIR